MRAVRSAVHWSLAVIIAIYVVSGLGITEFRTVEVLTFGLLGKALAFRIHTSLLIPATVLLVLHVALMLLPVRRRS